MSATLSVRLPEEQKEQFWDICHQNNKIPSRVIKYYMQKYIDENKN